MAEKEYIEREAAMHIVKCTCGDYATAFSMIRKLPAADVVEVVRCKDCKWYKESILLAPNKFCFRLMDRSGDRIGYNFSPDDFCSYGERKDGDKNAR